MLGRWPASPVPRRRLVPILSRALARWPEAQVRYRGQDGFRRERSRSLRWRRAPAAPPRPPPGQAATHPGARARTTSPDDGPSLPRGANPQREPLPSDCGRGERPPRGQRSRVAPRSSRSSPAASESVPRDRGARPETWPTVSDECLSSNPVSLNCLLELLRKRRKIDRGLFELARAGGRLLAGLSDVAHGLHNLGEADLLLVGACDNLLECLHALLNALGHLADGPIGNVGLLFPGLHPFHCLLGQHDPAVDSFLDVAENRSDLHGRLP